MAGWTCPYCNGSGVEKETVIYRGEVEIREVECRECNGEGVQDSYER